MIEDGTSLESLRIDTYCGSGRRMNISTNWVVGHYSVYPEDVVKLQFDSYSIYRNADKEMEKMINDKVFEIELAAAESLLREFDKNVRINSYLNYLNPHIYSGNIIGLVWEYDESSVDYYVPFIIDLDNGEFLDITDLITKEEFIGICQKGMKDAYRNERSEEETERGIMDLS